MGRWSESRRRPSSLAAPHVLTVQRCAAALLVLLSYGALLRLAYSIWLRDVAPEAHRRQATLPADYQTYNSWRTSAEPRRTSEDAGLVSTSPRRTAALLGQPYADEEGPYPTGEQAGDSERPGGGREDYDVSDLLEDFEPDEDAFESREEDAADDDADDDAEPPVNRRLLVFTSVPQAGSEVITLLLRWLSGQNQFSYVQLTTAGGGPLQPAEQRRLVEKIASFSKPVHDGVCVSHSAYVVDFSQHGSAAPLQFSLIRDPIDRVMSRFTHSRLVGGFGPPPGAEPAGQTPTLEQCLRDGRPECTFLNGHQYPELAVPFFCGHDSECTRHNSRWALERAKRTVERRFVTVGVLEDMNTTLAVAETLLPRFFSGAWDRFFIDLVGQIGDSMLIRPRGELSSKARSQLRANLTTEYEFYEFVLRRVEQQYNAFVLGS